MSYFIGEMIAEGIVAILRFLFVHVFKYIGAGIRWIFRLGKMPYSQILTKNGNGRITWFILAGIAAITLVYYSL